MGLVSDISLFGSKGTGLHTKAFVADERVAFLSDPSISIRVRPPSTLRWECSLSILH